jgi:hypothetical protein
MNKTITSNLAKVLLHKLKDNNRMFFIEYQKPFQERVHTMCRMLLKKQMSDSKGIFDRQEYDNIEVFNITDQSFLKLRIEEILFIRYNDKRYYVIQNN